MNQDNFIKEKRACRDKIHLLAIAIFDRLEWLEHIEMDCCNNNSFDSDEEVMSAVHNFRVALDKLIDIMDERYGDDEDEELNNKGE